MTPVELFSNTVSPDTTATLYTPYRFYETNVYTFAHISIIGIDRNRSELGHRQRKMASRHPPATTSGRREFSAHAHGGIPVLGETPAPPGVGGRGVEEHEDVRVDGRVGDGHSPEHGRHPARHAAVLRERVEHLEDVVGQRAHGEGGTDDDCHLQRLHLRRRQVPS